MNDNASILRSERLREGLTTLEEVVRVTASDQGIKR